MKKLLFILTISFLLFGCQKKVIDPNDFIKYVINSDNYTITSNESNGDYKIYLDGKKVKAEKNDIVTYQKLDTKNKCIYYIENKDGEWVCSSTTDISENEKAVLLSNFFPNYDESDFVQRIGTRIYDIKLSDEKIKEFVGEENYNEFKITYEGYLDLTNTKKVVYYFKVQSQFNVIEECTYTISNIGKTNVKIPSYKTK